MTEIVIVIERIKLWRKTTQSNSFHATIVFCVKGMRHLILGYNAKTYASAFPDYSDASSGFMLSLSQKSLKETDGNLF